MLTTKTTNSIRRKRPTKRPLRRRLSAIFANLPDMMKLQVLEFVGFSPNDTFILDYVCKYKKIVKIVNPIFMRAMLDFKVNNPPIPVVINNKDGYTITLPNKVQSYTRIIDSYKLVISEMDKRNIRECNEMSKHIKLIRSNTTNTFPLKQKQKQELLSTRYNIYFCDPKPKVMFSKNK
jgi:hypothetical protein